MKAPYRCYAVERIPVVLKKTVTFTFTLFRQVLKSAYNRCSILLFLRGGVFDGTMLLAMKSIPQYIFCFDPSIKCFL